jgi:hypothetical protein
MGKTQQVQSYITFVQGALPNDNEIVRYCRLTLRARAGTLALMSKRLSDMLTTTMMTAAPKRVAAASS